MGSVSTGTRVAILLAVCQSVSERQWCSGHCHSDNVDVTRNTTSFPSGMPLIGGQFPNPLHCERRARLNSILFEVGCDVHHEWQCAQQRGNFMMPEQSKIPMEDKPYHCCDPLKEQDRFSNSSVVPDCVRSIAYLIAGHHGYSRTTVNHGDERHRMWIAV